jgi:hypothetical protein
VTGGCGVGVTVFGKVGWLGAQAVFVIRKIFSQLEMAILTRNVLNGIMLFII